MTLNAYKIKRFEAQKKKRAERAKKVKKPKNFTLARKLMRWKNLKE